MIFFINSYCILDYVFYFKPICFGKWKSVDVETGEEKSIVEIYEQNGKVFGKIIGILNLEHKGDLCENVNVMKKTNLF